MTLHHTVVQGEGISALSARYGFAPETIWRHPENTALRDLRTDPNVLMPGDIIVIPDLQAQELACAIGQRHVFRRKGVPARFELQLTGEHGALAHTAYVLEVEGREYRGSTDADGILRHGVPNGARHGSLHYELDGTTQLLAIDFGSLDPVDELSGVQKRLENLGYPCDAPGVDGPRTRLALQCFQLAADLEPTGERDAPTLASLVRLHDSRATFPAPEA